VDLQPHVTIITTTTNWAPYRSELDRWSPYGWTWVGEEQWGWAPLQLGRWVYYNKLLGLGPRSIYYRSQMVAAGASRLWVVPIFSLGDSICWDPPYIVASTFALQPHKRTALTMRGHELATFGRGKSRLCTCPCQRYRRKPVAPAAGRTAGSNDVAARRGP